MKIANNVVIAGKFSQLDLTGENRTRLGPWTAACLSSATGPTWVFVDAEGNIVPLSSVKVAWR